jgi:hypothetical protein
MKTIKILKLAVIAFFMAGFWASCTYETLPLPEVPDEISFSENIVPILNTSCNGAGCHNQGGIPPNLSEDVAWANLVFGGYVDTLNVESSILYVKILPPGGSMAKFASDQDRALILNWIEQGAKDN